MLLALRRSHDNGDWKKFSISWREALGVGAKKMTKTPEERSWRTFSDVGANPSFSIKSKEWTWKWKWGDSSDTIGIFLLNSETPAQQNSTTAPSSLPVPITAPCACRHDHVSWWCLCKFFGDPEVYFHLSTLHSILKNQPETERKENEPHLSLQCLVTLCALLYLHLKIL